MPASSTGTSSDPGPIPDPGESGVMDLLLCPSPSSWADAMAADVPTLLIDHANCEKKAASTALSLMFRYADRQALVYRMSRLAREELRHFEQVHRLMNRRGVTYRRLRPARYAEGLRKALRDYEPARLVDQLIVGAFIEARSCERFALLVPRVDEELGKFYRGLLGSEARHFRQYIELARRYDESGETDTRAREIGEVEAELARDPDEILRFHSGPPATP